MADVTNDGTHSSHQRENKGNEIRMKGNLAQGRAFISTSDNRKSMIPVETPGKDISIRPRSPFRDIRPNNRNWGSSTRHEEDSVKVDGSTIRSVFEIAQSPVARSVERIPSPEYRSHHHHGHHYPNHYGAYPPPHPNYYMYPPPAPVAAPPPEALIPDYNCMTDEEQKEARIIFKSKFAALRENYPEKSFDEYDDELPLRVIHKIYEDYLRKLDIESNSSFSRVILSFIFLGIEAFAIRVMGMDLRGYAKAQIAAMKRYDRLLLELGEKYSGSGGDWPAEMRLIMLALFNALIIVGVKFICDKIGSKDSQWMVDMVNGMIGGQVDSLVEAKPPPEVDPVTKTPNVKPDDRRNLMGNVQNLMAMAGQLSPDGDLTTAIGNLGSSIIDHTIAKPGTDDKSAPQQRKTRVRFGRRD